MAETEKRAIFEWFTESASLPHVPLATLPTPVERLEVELPFETWVKRDDLTANEYGGNKVRKLEFLLGDAIQKGHTKVCTVGAIGSHHVLATCIFAESLGLGREALHFPQPLTDHVRNNLLALSTTHPELKLLTTKFGLPAEMLKQKIAEWSGANPDVYYIPGGGSSPIGAVGYVNAALEFADQLKAGECDRPDAIYVAAGTCGTLAGLMVGLRLAELDIPVFGVRVVDRVVANSPLVQALALRTCDLLRQHGVPATRKLVEDDVHLIHDALGADYGVPTDEGLHAIELLRGHLKLEPTYTAKAFAAMMRHADGRYNSVLYWHTLSGADLTARIERADINDLPPEYGKFFE